MVLNNNQQEQAEGQGGANADCKQEDENGKPVNMTVVRNKVSGRIAVVCGYDSGIINAMVIDEKTGATHQNFTLNGASRNASATDVIPTSRRIS